MRPVFSIVMMLVATSVPFGIPPQRRLVAHFAPEAAVESKKAEQLTDAQVKSILIGDSIAAYDGNCPCPYSRASNGSRCGKRSAWSRRGGAQPLCYPTEISPEMVRAYRDAHSEN